MRHFMIRAFEALILLFCGIAAIAVCILAAGLVASGQVLPGLEQLGIAAPMLGASDPAAVLDALESGSQRAGPAEVWLSAAVLVVSGFVGIILFGGGALTLTGIYRKMARLVDLVDATPVD
ncbi:hypothetical protein [Oceanicola sp. S124]|uniref:hypothetical protein n=1 Tax=Oceanicola sp. S124 TaxID=1042378 RepID=UPI00025599DB|nr:hypothetical protein [Oceanicola sp. S124]